MTTLQGEYESRAEKLIQSIDESTRAILGAELPQTVSEARKRCASFREQSSTRLHSFLQDQSTVLDLFQEIITAERRLGAHKIGYAPPDDLSLETIANAITDYIESEVRAQM